MENKTEKNGETAISHSLGIYQDVLCVLYTSNKLSANAFMSLIIKYHRLRDMDVICAFFSVKKVKIVNESPLNFFLLNFI